MKEKPGSFVFETYDLDYKKGVISFAYLLETWGRKIRFTDRLIFEPHGAKKIPPPAESAILKTMHLVFGINYWKLACPRDIEIAGYTLTREEARFWDTIYTRGLGEFYYKNKIDFRALVRFPFERKKYAITRPAPMRAPNRSLLLVGGGKDSLVSAELLKKTGKRFDPFVLNTSRIQEDALTVLGKKPIRMHHEIDLQLLKLVKQPGMHSGHVPVSIFYTVAALFAALAYGYRYIIASNEASASYGNVRYRGAMINHQWSKTFACEKLLAGYFQTHITKDVAYFSLLRPLTEVKIAEIFSHYKKYFPVFSSCNRNFKIHDALKGKRWCGACPKCAFVFALLAAFVPREYLLKIFGKNLFADKNLIPTYEELLGIKRTKPFECVGTPAETRYALWRVHQQGEYVHDPVLRFFAKRVLPKIRNPRALERQAMQKNTRHQIPREFSRTLEAI